MPTDWQNNRKIAQICCNSCQMECTGQGLCSQGKPLGLEHHPLWMTLQSYDIRKRHFILPHTFSHFLTLPHTFSHFLTLSHTFSYLAYPFNSLSKILAIQKYDTYDPKVWYLRYKSKILTVSILNFNTERLNSEYWILKNTSVKYVLNTYDNYLYIISLYSFLIALYIKDVKPISSASAVQKHTIFQTVLYSEILKNAGYQGLNIDFRRMLLIF